MRNVRRLSDDGGFSLVELAVYILVLGIISAVVTAVLISLFKSEDTVSGISITTSDSQNMIAFLSKDVRNSRQFQSSPDGTTLTASVAGGDAGTVVWQCVRWSVVGTGIDRSVVRQTKSDSAGAGWGSMTTLINKVRAIGSTPFFEGNAVMGSRGSLKYSIQIATTETGAIKVTGQIGNTQQGSAAASYCF